MLARIKPDITLISISRVWPIIRAGITWEAATNDAALSLVFRRVKLAGSLHGINFAIHGKSLHYLLLVSPEPFQQGKRPVALFLCVAHVGTDVGQEHRDRH